MKVVMTLVIRDEVDLVDAHLSFHLNAGVDFVLATDHKSEDGTTEVLESYARAGALRLFREEGAKIRQDVWQTRMARLAAAEHGARWVIATDADEFWWPRAGTLREVLAAVPAAYGVVRGYSQSFLPRPGSEWFPERMTVRLASTAPINDPATPYRPVAKVAFRADPRVVVGWGNHHISGVPVSVLRGWSPVELLHFPVRSAEQIARKYSNKATAWTSNLRGDLARARSALDHGRPDAIYERLVVDDTSVARGLASGVLVEDLRLRDALRALGGQHGFARRAEEPAASCRGSEAVPHAFDVSILDEADLVRSQRRVDDLVSRVAMLTDARRSDGADRR